MPKKISRCRNCKKKKLTNLFSLGNISYTGKFSKKKKYNIPKAKITILKCNFCHLVQLDRNFNPKYLYSNDYGYRSGINETMSTHLIKTANLLKNKTKLIKGDYVLDIASNDGTLLNGYKEKGIIKVGIDPIIKNFSKFYKNINFSINNFFTYKEIIKYKFKKKFKIITALSVFYDLKDPNKFLYDIYKTLDEKNGIFLLEHTDLLSIIKKKLFDTICHEHLEYYSMHVIINMVKKNGLRVFDLSSNNINGGSIRFFICHKNARYKNNTKKINNFLTLEQKAKLKSIITYKVFFKQVLKMKKSLKKIIKNIKLRKEIVHGYGASTKGNVLLQFFKINNKEIPFIADRNKAKCNSFTPGTKIKIITEKNSRRLKPDYYLVLPWHFKKEILQREKSIMQKGTKFIFPLPKIKIY